MSTYSHDALAYEYLSKITNKTVHFIFKRSTNSYIVNKVDKENKNLIIKYCECKEDSEYKDYIMKYYRELKDSDKKVYSSILFFNFLYSLLSTTFSKLLFFEKSIKSTLKLEKFDKSLS